MEGVGAFDGVRACMIGNGCAPHVHTAARRNLLSRRCRVPPWPFGVRTRSLLFAVASRSRQNNGHGDGQSLEWQVVVHQLVRGTTDAAAHRRGHGDALVLDRDARQRGHVDRGLARYMHRWKHETRTRKVVKVVVAVAGAIL